MVVCRPHGSPFSRVGPRALHIVRRHGSTGDAGRRRITDCNRVLTHYDTQIDSSVFRSNRFTLCARCGTLEDFEKALDAYHVARKQRDAEQTIAREQFHKRLAEEREVRAQALRHLGGLIEPILTFDYDEENQCITIPFVGYTFTVIVELNK